MKKIAAALLTLVCVSGIAMAEDLTQSKVFLRETAPTRSSGLSGCELERFAALNLWTDSFAWYTAHMRLRL